MQDSLQGSSPPRLSKSGGTEHDLGPKTFQCQGKAEVRTNLDRILLKPCFSGSLVTILACTIPEWEEFERLT